MGKGQVVAAALDFVEGEDAGSPGVGDGPFFEGVEAVGGGIWLVDICADEFFEGADAADVAVVTQGGVGAGRFG